MDQQQLHEFEAKCIQEEQPVCQTMCPLHVDVRAFAKAMGAQKLKEARKVLDRAMPLAMLTGHLCHGACLPHCLRNQIDAPVNLPLLEKACLLATQSIKPMPMPPTGKKIAVAGSDLSSLVLAWELGKKGHHVSIFYTNEPGGTLVTLPAYTLPPHALNDALGQLLAVRITLVSCSEKNIARWLKTTTDFDAIFLGLDDPHFDMNSCPASLGAKLPSNQLTLETSDPHVFAGGLTDSSFVTRAADGKRAAGSIERFLQHVSPSTAREKEGTFPSLLYTDISQIKTAMPIVPRIQTEPSLDEAAAESKRCIQCTCLECVKVCPYLEHYNGYPKKYAREIYNNLSVVHGIRQANKMINSCTECGLCATICPHNADVGSLCAVARQEMVKTNRMPPSAHEFALEDMEYSNADDVAFLRHQPGTQKSAYLFFPGCQLPATLSAQTKDVYKHLCKHLTGGVGFFFQCCGAPAKWSGRSQLTRKNTDAIQKRWERFEKPTVIVACASCRLFFQKELPCIPLVSLWELLASLPLPQYAKAWTQHIALHDPCAAREDEKTRQSVRILLQAILQKNEEMPLHGKTTTCCGYGGLAFAANPQVADLFAATRATQSEFPLLSYCVMCRDRMRASNKESLHLLDLLFPELPHQEAALRPSPGISERQTNRLAFRTDLLEECWQENSHSAPLRNLLRIPHELQPLLEKRRILHADILLVLEHARKHGPLFTFAKTNICLAALRPRQVTFWVRYEGLPDSTYLIHDAYSHRMVVKGVQGEGRESPCTLEGYAVKGGRL